MRNAEAATRPTQRSLHRKIHLVLEEARKGKARSADALVQQITDAGHLDFTVLRIGARGQKIPKACSEESVARAVAICGSLGLLDISTGKLTERGHKATIGDQFESVMRVVLAAALERLGAPVGRIREISGEALSSGKADSLPTWKVVADRLKDLKDRRMFHIYLSMFAGCQGLTTFRRKIYLPK